MEIQGNSSLQNVSGLSQLVTVGGDSLRIHRNNSLISIEIPLLREVNRFLDSRNSA